MYAVKALLTCLSRWQSRGRIRGRAAQCTSRRPLRKAGEAGRHATASCAVLLAVAEPQHWRPPCPPLRSPRNKLSPKAATAVGVRAAPRSETYVGCATAGAAYC